ncbi:hypothetical protein [Pseudomonas putida]|uniref:Uncharacterized protein n=1 Tax=Pseudomonas putida TaxID=303 RepID=A0A1B2F1Y7_PSEPU|nr:hypothetical protein [Pseudomonas putida]ANY86216.1 hypothetical protein IEC33019_0632 [Pseudomonas putida]MCL8306753.1 hypothetical protein [Pseudomonas putida]
MPNYVEKLAAAAQQNFSRAVTGYLLDARLKENGVRGAIFSDSLNRHEDGDSITTSAIQETRQEHGYTLFLTVSGSCYVAVTHLLFVEESFGGISQTVILRAS